MPFFKALIIRKCKDLNAMKMSAFDDRCPNLDNSRFFTVNNVK